MDEGDAKRRFAGARVARMATVTDRDTPHVVPIVFALEGDTVSSLVDAKPKRSPRLQRLRNIEANPAVSLLVDHYDDEWKELWWVRADGEARVVGEGTERDHAVELLTEKYRQYETWSDPIGGAVLVEVRRWSWWEFTPS